MSSQATPKFVESNVVSTSNQPSRYESQKKRDWETFCHYLHNHEPPLELSQCRGTHIVEFLQYSNQFGKTKIHTAACPFYGLRKTLGLCHCPRKQAWGSLDSLIGRLRAAYLENGGLNETNPFGDPAIKIFLKKVKDIEFKARGLTCERNKEKQMNSVSCSVKLKRILMTPPLPSTTIAPKSSVVQESQEFNYVNFDNESHFDELTRVLGMPTMGITDDEAGMIVKNELGGGYTFDDGWSFDMSSIDNIYY